MVLNKGIREKRSTDLGLRIALGLVLAVMLIAGLTPGGYRFRNDVHWNGNGSGLRFEQYGIAYTSPFLTKATARRMNQSGATFLLNLMFPPDPPKKFQFIASFHNGDDRSQLVLAQWQTELIVMNGDDYSHVRKTPRVSADLTNYLNRPILLAISTSPSGTLIEADGKIVGHNAGVHILIPEAEQSSRLTLGNSVHSNNGWTGTLLGFGVLSRPLTDAELERTTDLRSMPSKETIQLLRFDEGSGDVVRDSSGAHNDATLPARLTPLERSLLADDPSRDEGGNWRIKDVAVNLLGFIPFGLLLAIILHNRGYRALQILLAVTFSGFVLSLGIETVQAWIPTRTSSLVDLSLNTVGAAAGALLYRKKS